jgi:hypothetical protein
LMIMIIFAGHCECEAPQALGKPVTSPSQQK